MATFVLVPGAWLGGWAWDGVASRLRDRGHDVHPVTLSGLGERGDAGETIDQETHVGDVVREIESTGATDVILVGHSYGGVPVTGAADRIPERLASVVYVDSGPAIDGTAFVDANPPELKEAVERQVREQGDGRLFPMPSWEELEQEHGAHTEGLDDATRARIRERAKPQPFGTYTQALHLTNPDRTKLPHVLVSCSFPLDQVRTMIDQGHPWFAELAGPQWSFVEVRTGHWPMFSEPDALAEALDAVARERSAGG